MKLNFLTRLLVAAILVLAPVQSFAIGEYGAIYVGQGPSAPAAWSGSAAGLPVVSACGTGPTIVGNDLRGTITTGTGSPTACTMTFGSALPSAPTCQLTGWTTITPTITSVSNTALVIGGTLGSSIKITYTCIQ